MTHVENLFAALGAEEDREVVVDADTGRSVTAGEFLDLVRRYAAGLHLTCGVGPGALVAVVAPATIDGIALRYAAAALGCATVYCPGADAPDRLSRFVADVGADVVVAFPETADAVHSVSARVVAAETLTDGPARPVPVQVDPDTPSVLVASGGTTGVSKASVRDWRQYARMVDIGPCPGRRQLICTPLAYIAQVLVDSVLTGGGVMVLRRRFDPDDVLASVRDHRITHLTVVEPQLVRLVDAVTTAADLASLQAITHVGCDAGASLRARLLTRLGAPILVNPYGASEFGVVSALAAPDYSLAHPELLDSSGTVMDGVDVRIGTRGTFEVRRGAVARRYTTAAGAFGADGWFDTNDVGTVDAARYLRVRGRASDARIINGRTMFPSDLHDAFCAAPGVRYAVALPSPDGSGFGVAVTLSGVSVDDAVQAVAERDPHLVPTAAVGVEVMPTTEQGKPNRRLLTELLWPA